VSEYHSPASVASVRRAAAAVLGDLQAVDGALYAAVAATPTPTLDRALRRLSHTADHSKISLAVAAGLALGPGRSRRAAVAGVGAVALASATANLFGKRMVRRRRPDREQARVNVALGYSRVHTGVHYPGDVAAGAVLGFASAAVSLAVGRALLVRGVIRPTVRGPSG